MSGTSVDGLDCALVTLSGQGIYTRLQDVVSETIAYSADEQRSILALFGAETPLTVICQANFWLAELFANKALRFLSHRGVATADVAAIGSHGQTVWHLPPSAIRRSPEKAQTASTLQIGEPAVIAARTGVVTVGDFRVADLALGGEGAPLVPYVDWLLYRAPGTRRALQNIGGIANVAVVGEEASSVLAFDNGPGNMVMDALARIATDGTHAFDPEGQLAAQACVQPAVLDWLMTDEYLALPPPKSTGRERYGSAFAQGLCARFPEVSALDLLATATEWTARAIAHSLQRAEVSELLVSGGGAHNVSLMRALQRHLSPVPVRSLSGVVPGIDVDNKEAVAFAILAAHALDGEPANLPHVTGARGRAILGKICQPPPVTGSG